MSTYELSRGTLNYRKIDTWAPFKIHHIGDDVFLQDDLAGNQYCGMAYMDDSKQLTEVEMGWSGVSITNRSSLVNESCEYLSDTTMIGLEPGVYQCILVDVMNCDDCIDDYDDMCDHLAGWALVKLDDA